MSRTVFTLGLVAATGAASGVAAQTLQGKLLNGVDDQPINLGLVILSTLEGDSVDAVLTDSDGDFRVEAGEGGSFLLTGAALGFRERRAGVFDLADGSSMTLEFRLEPEAITLEGLIVHAESYRSEPALVRNGFYRRMQRGLGRYLTPEDLERSFAIETEDLLFGIPGVRVVPGVFTSSVSIRGAQGRYCTPEVYVDGVRIGYDPRFVRLTDLVSVEQLSAVEVYAGTASIPIEYGMFIECGVLVFWTKS